MLSNKIEIIQKWLKEIYREKKAVIAVSGGVDSAVALTLLVKALGKERVIPMSLPYGEQDMTDAKLITRWNGLEDKMIEINIAQMVDTTTRELQITDEALRKGNIMARMRMIVVFDIAKKMGGMVCGTENKTEQLLGYFTRFGDSASDVEPIASLYKTEVWEIAKELGLPEIFYTKAPTAGLWSGQTDETEMGFSYKDADRVLSGDIENIDPAIVAKVEKMVQANKFKLEVPYLL
ncbi:MAG: NAD(+) synthase [bacterium]